MTIPHTAMVFAAGRGTRMRHLTDSTPKPLIKVHGKTLLDHALDRVREADVPHAVINTHYQANQIATHLTAINTPKIEISHEQSACLETGGGIRHAQGLLGTDPILTLNADAVWTGPNPLIACLTAWQPDKMDALLLLTRIENATGHKGKGDFSLDAQMRPIRRGNADTAPFVYVGAQIIKPATVYDHAEDVFSLNVIWDQLIARGTLFAAVFDGGWCDVGQPESIPLAEALLS